MSEKKDFLDKYLPYMTEEERKFVDKASPSDIRLAQRFSRLMLDDSIIENIKHNYTGWFDNFSKVLSEVMSPKEALVFGGLLAATSPRTAIHTNLLIALDLFEFWLDSNGNVSLDKVKEFRDKYKDDPRFPGLNRLMTPMLGNVMKVFSKPEELSKEGYLSFFSSGKIDSFRQNLLKAIAKSSQNSYLNEKGEAVTNDSWIFRAWGLSDKESSKAFGPSVYPLSSAAIRRFTELLNSGDTSRKWTPSEVQASLWELIRGLSRAVGRGASRHISNNPVVHIREFGFNVLDPSRRLVSTGDKDKVFKEIKPTDLSQYNFKDFFLAEPVANRIKSLVSKGSNIDKYKKPVEPYLPLDNTEKSQDVLADTKGYQQLKERVKDSAFRGSFMKFCKVKFSRARKADLIMASPSTEESLSFKEAARRLRSANVAAYVSLLKDALENIAPKIRVALGAWADGAEPSVVIETDSADEKSLKQAAAWAGLLSKQKAVLTFSPDDEGPHYLYKGYFKNLPLEEVNKRFDEANLYRTLVPEDDSIGFYVFSENPVDTDSLRKKDEQFFVETQRGKGEFIGSDTRASAAKLFRDILDREKAS